MPKIIFNIATVERRRDMFFDVLRNLSKQTIKCDRINVAMSYSDMDNEIFYFLKNNFDDFHIKIRPNMACEQKLFAIDKTDADSYFLTFDDDIIYPENYCERMLHGIQQYNHRNIVGFHGITFKSYPITDYKKQKNVHCYYQNIPSDIDAKVIGTGAMGLHLSILKNAGFSFDNIKQDANCIDATLARFCRDKGIRMIVLKHEAQWMKIYPDSQDYDALWRKSQRMKYKNKIVFLSDLNKTKDGILRTDDPIYGRPEPDGCDCIEGSGAEA